MKVVYVIVVALVLIALGYWMGHYPEQVAAVKARIAAAASKAIAHFRKDKAP